MWLLTGLAIVLSAVIAYDLLQRQHAILRNFPVIGHFRYWLEAVGPELRQYIVTDNNEERPFSRDQRRWVYASSKHENNYFGFGSDNEMELHRTTSSSNTTPFRSQRSFPATPVTTPSSPSHAPRSSARHASARRRSARLRSSTSRA
jgi:glutamate synthase domain-containing protein 2